MKDCKLGHIPPVYHGYDGRWDNVTKCDDCKSIGLYEDQHPALPCKRCGGVVRKIGAGRWFNPTYSGFLFWKKVITRGQWMLKGDNQ